MGSALPFFAAVLTAVTIENAVFTRGLGLGRAALFMKGPRQGILYGGIVVWILGITSFLIAGINNALLDHPLVMYIRAPLFFLGVGVVYVFTYIFIRTNLPALFGEIAGVLPFATFNTAVFGAFYICVIQNYSFGRTVGYCLGTGIGYTLAILVIYYARKRLSISPVPRSFRGLPVLLLYIGILSLALYGLTGHGLVL